MAARTSKLHYLAVVWYKWCTAYQQNDQQTYHIAEGSFLRYNVKVKVTLEQAMKAQRGSRGIALLFL